MTTNTRSANARTMPSRRDALGAICTLAIAASTAAALVGLTIQPPPADPIGAMIAKMEA